MTCQRLCTCISFQDWKGTKGTGAPSHCSIWGFVTVRRSHNQATVVGQGGQSATRQSLPAHCDFDVSTSNLWIRLSPMAEEDLQRWTSAHNVLRGGPVTLVISVWTTTEKTLHINAVMLFAFAIQPHYTHWNSNYCVTVVSLMLTTTHKATAIIHKYYVIIMTKTPNCPLCVTVLMACHNNSIY